MSKPLTWEEFEARMNKWVASIAERIRAQYPDNVGPREVVVRPITGARHLDISEVHLVRDFERDESPGYSLRFIQRNPGDKSPSPCAVLTVKYTFPSSIPPARVTEHHRRVVRSTELLGGLPWVVLDLEAEMLMSLKRYSRSVEGFRKATDSGEESQKTDPP